MSNGVNLILIPFFLIAFSSLITPFLGIFLKNKIWLWYFSLTAVFLALFFSILGFGKSLEIKNLFRLDEFSSFFNIVFLSVGFFVILSFKKIKDSFGSLTWYSLIFFTLLGLMLAASARDLIAMFLAIELVGFSVFILIAFSGSRLKLEASIKYFITSLMASGILILGLVLIYGASSETNIYKIADIIAFDKIPLPILSLGLILAVAGLGFKMSVFPFNLWLPDVYQGAQSRISALLAGAVKKGGFAIFLRLLFGGLVSFNFFWAPIFAILAVFTMSFGNITALLQKNVKRMLAYSIIGQAGYMMIGVAVATQFGITGTLFHILTHALMATGAFIIIGILAGKRFHTIDDYNGLGSKNVFLAITLTIFFASLTGVPLFAGFSSKFVLFSGPIKEGMVWLALVAILNSLISVFYYFRVVRAMFAEKAKIKEKILLPPNVSLSILILVIFTILIGIWSQPFYLFSQTAASSLFP